MDLCEYGCGNKSKYITSNGKKCCSVHISKCLEVKRKISLSLKNKPSKKFDKVLCKYCDNKIGKNSIIKHRKLCYFKPIKY